VGLRHEFCHRPLCSRSTRLPLITRRPYGFNVGIVIERRQRRLDPPQIPKMIRQDFNRIDPKRRNVLNHRQKQFAQPQFQDVDYPHRLNFYTTPPTADITLEQFEQWAIDRLRSNRDLRSDASRSLLTKIYSSRRTRSMLFQKQKPRRNRRTHEASP
jgi:hypothetical protein